MLIIPELDTVVITPPRTGSTSLRKAVLKKYKYAFSPYRHMERDGIPTPYKNCRVLGTFRAPLDRLRSIHRYMREVSFDRNPHAPRYWIDRLNAQGAMPFELWLVQSTEMFSDPYNDAGKLVPHYTTMRPYPITRKPQADYYRPDLGPVKVGSVEIIAGLLNVDVPHINTTTEREYSETPQFVFQWLYDWHNDDCEQSTYLTCNSKSVANWVTNYQPKFMYQES